MSKRAFHPCLMASGSRRARSHGCFLLHLHREQRQKDSVKVAGNSFPRDMDYRQEALQDKAPSSKYGARLRTTSPERSLTPPSLVLFISAETSGDLSTASNSSHSASSSSSQSLNAAPGPASSTLSSSSSSSSLMHGPQPVQSPSPTLLQDPALLHQLLPALKATLQMNNGSMDVAKLNEGGGSGRWTAAKK